MGLRMGSRSDAFPLLREQSAAVRGWNPPYTRFFSVQLLHGQAACLVTWECTNPSRTAVLSWGLLLLLLLRVLRCMCTRSLLTFPVCMRGLPQGPLSPLSQDTSCRFLVFIFIILISFCRTFPSGKARACGGARCWWPLLSQEPQKRRDVCSRALLLLPRPSSSSGCRAGSRPGVGCYKLLWCCTGSLIACCAELELTPAHGSSWGGLRGAASAIRRWHKDPRCSGTFPLCCSVTLP